MLPTSAEAFPHPTQTDRPGEPKGRCRACGARNNTAIHDRDFAMTTTAWGGPLWWPKVPPIDCCTDTHREAT